MDEVVRAESVCPPHLYLALQSFDGDVVRGADGDDDVDIWRTNLRQPEECVGAVGGH